MRFFEFNKSDTDLESALINVLLNMKGDADEQDKATDISMDAVKQIMSNTGYPAFNYDVFKKIYDQDEDLQKAVANDGTLPGGMDPEIFKSLMANPEVMAMLQNPKLQKAMKIMMSEGQPGLEKAMAADPEMTEIIKKLNSLVSFM